MEDKLRQKIENAFLTATTEAKKSADWYSKSIAGKRSYSKIIRLGSIILFGLGGIFPLVSNLSDDSSLKYFSNWGYISFALAGTLIFIDRFFGFSSGWIRYILTEMEIRKQIKSIEHRWEIEISKIDSNPTTLTSEKTTELLNLIRDFSNDISELEKQETTAWATEFQSNIAELQKMANAKLESLVPGSIKVVAKNTTKYIDIKILTDNIERKALVGSEGLIENVSPGPHEVSLSGISQENGQKVTTTAVINVEVNKMCTVEISMP